MNFGDLLVYVVSFFGLYTSIFFLLTMYEHKGEKKIKPPSKLPKVCIIVPCFNEESTVAKTLKSLLELDYPKRLLDIMVVDDGSTDETFRIASTFVTKGIRVFRKKNGGKFTALNYGLKKTDAEFVGALDADSYVDSPALKRMIGYFKNKQCMAITPSLKINGQSTFLQRVQTIEYLIGIFLRKIFAYLGAIHVTPGPFTIYRKSFFDTYGNYREAYMTEDIEIALRIQSHHFDIDNAPDAYVYTEGPVSFKTLYKQRLRWYYGFLQNISDYKQMFSPRHGNLGLFVLPSAFMSIFLVIISLFYSMYALSKTAMKRVMNSIAVDYDIIRMIDFDIDWFYIDSSPIFYLSILAFIVGVAIFIVARQISSEEQPLTFSYILYLISYWFLFGYWWIAAIAHKILGITTSWGHKSGS